jgi:large subunit ribosomal protein L13
LGFFGVPEMPSARISSFLAKPGQVPQKWYHLDASDQVLGRLAVKVATVLMGKHRPTYTPHVDTGEFVVVTNAEKVRVTGTKDQVKVYPSYSYYPGGYRERTYHEVMKAHPDRILREAVRRMLPKNALGRHMLDKLKVYAGTTHPHAAQQPEPFPL